MSNELFDDDNTTSTLGVSIVPPSERSPIDGIITWEDYAKTATTGDVILCSGTTGLSQAIRIAESFPRESKWSHVALTVEAIDKKTGKRRLLMLESTGDDAIIDVQTGGTEGGPRLADAESNIRRYIGGADGAVVIVRRLYIDERFEEIMGFDPASRLGDLKAFIDHVKLFPYETNLFEFGRAAPIGRWLQLFYSRSKQTKNAYFCSELIYEALLVMGLVANKNPSIVTPDDFDRYHQTIEFPFVPGTGKGTGRRIQPLVGLGPQLRIVFPTDGPERSIRHPGGIRHPIRPFLAISTPESILLQERKAKAKQREKMNQRGFPMDARDHI